MEQYVGLPIHLSMKNRSSIEGVVSSIDLSTQTLTLENVRSKIADHSPWKSLDRIKVSGMDISNLQILETPSAQSLAPQEPVVERKKTVFSADDVERTLRSTLPPPSKKQGLPGSMAPITTKKPITRTNSIIGCLDEDFKQLDLDSLSSQQPITTTTRQMVPSMAPKQHTWSQDVKSFKQQGDFDFQASLMQFDKKKHYEEFKEQLEGKKGKTTLAAVNKPKPSVPIIEQTPQVKLTQRIAKNDKMPIVRLSLLNKVIVYAANKWGPNTVQLIENAARSIAELLSTKLLPATGGSKMKYGALLFVESHKVGAIGLAVGRHLINRCGYDVVVAMTPDLDGETSNELDASEDKQSIHEKAKKAYIFQKEIGSRHGITMLSQEADLMSHVSNLTKENVIFNLVIDALTTYEVDIGSKANTHRIWSAPFQKWFTQTFSDCAIIVSIHRRAKYFRKSNHYLVMLGLPCKTEDTHEDVKGIFIVDIGLSPQLWLKFAGSESSDGKYLTIEFLRGIYRKHSYVELSDVDEVSGNGMFHHEHSA